MTIESDHQEIAATQGEPGASGFELDHGAALPRSTVADEGTNVANPNPNPNPNTDEELRAENLALASRLREALLATDSAIEPGLVTGETVAEIDASYAAAKAMADRVRESVRRESLAAGAGVVPAGAPGRTLSRPLNARDKIRAGLSRQAGSGG